MKIIQNNNVKEDIKEIEYICEKCNSIFEYDNYDINIDEDKMEFVICPCCNHKCIIDIPITEKNIEFPKSFHQFSVEKGAVEIDNKEITSKIKEKILWLKNHPEEPYGYCASGDTFLCVFNHQDEYYIIVTKNYFDTSIDKT